MLWYALINERVTLFVLYAFQAFDHVRWPRDGLPSACDLPRVVLIRYSRRRLYRVTSKTGLLTLVICEKRIFKPMVKCLPKWDNDWLGLRTKVYNSKRRIKAHFVDHENPPERWNIELKPEVKGWSLPLIRSPLDQYIWRTCSNFIKSVRIGYFFFFLSCFAL